MSVRIVVLSEVREYFKELIYILYKENYFGYEDSAVEYVDSLFDDIEATLPLRGRKRAPEYFSRYGEDLYYAVFKKNKSTRWYVFFTIYAYKEEKTYLIRYVSNNHVIAQYFE